MLVGLGWRITGYCDAADTRTVAITSRDAAGVRFIITAHKDRVGDGWCCVGGTSVDICHKQEVHIDIKTCVSKTHSYSTISISLILCMYTDNIYIYINYALFDHVFRDVVLFFPMTLWPATIPGAEDGGFRKRTPCEASEIDTGDTQTCWDREIRGCSIKIDHMFFFVLMFSWASQLIAVDDIAPNSLDGLNQKFLPMKT